MTAESAAVTARISGSTNTNAPVLSPWTGIFDKLQSATVGEYQVIRELGRGGMAAVFLAHDVRLDRKVALKVMSPMLATDGKMVDRFRREAKTGAGLKHPNIGTVYRVLEGEGLYFFVMDFVRGRPLDTIIRRNGVLSVPAVRALLYQIGSGLAYAHRRKIYHRDVKPGNVLLSAADGTAVITDFGIAKVAESPNQTQTGAVVGTPAYMAPEQILGREVGAEVDQYALGIVAYEMLTGTPPFVGTNFVVMHAHTEIQPRAIRESRPECPPELDEAIMRMLAKEPGQRWPSLSHALAAMGATLISEDDPIRDELIRLATPDDAEAARFATNTPNPAPQHSARWAHVTNVVIYSPPPAIEVGDSFRLTASPRDAQGDVVPEAPLDWSSSNSAVFAVNRDGLVTALAVGTAEVHAMSGTARGTIAVSVVPSRVVNLQLSIPPGVLVAGDRIQLAARAVDKHQRPLAYSVRWGVADPSVADVSPEGVLQARAPGLVEVFAEANGVRTGARVEVASPAVQSIRLTTEPANPVVGDRIVIDATLLDAEGQPLRDRATAWTINDRSLVRVVTDGVYEAISDGRLIVSITSEGKIASSELIIAPAPVATVRISQAPQSIVVGSTFRLTGSAHDVRGKVLPGRKVEWSVGDSSFASVSDTGTVSALGSGDLRIVATCEGKTAALPISIQPPPISAVRVSGVPQAVYVKMPFRLAAVIIDGWGKQIHRTVEWRSSNVSIVSIAPTGEATASAVGHVRISAVVEGVEGSVEIDVVEPPLPKTVVVPVLPPVARPIISAPASAPTAPMVPMTATTRSAEELEAAVNAPTEPMGIPVVDPMAGPPSDITADVDESSAPPRLLAPTPVLAPKVNHPPPPVPRRKGRSKVLIGVSAVVVLGGIGLTTATLRHRPSSGVAAGDQAPQVAQTGAESPSGSTPITPASLPTTAARAPERPASSRGRDSLASGEAKNDDFGPSKARDAFRLTIVPQPPLRVGETSTMHANLEHVTGNGPAPRITWMSTKPAVVRVDPVTGAITALAEGQSVLRAMGGGARADIFVSVIVAPSLQTNAPSAEPARVAGPSAEELRAKASEALHESANAMVAALKSKDGAQVKQLFGDGVNGDANDLTKSMRDQFGFTASVVQIDQPQLADKSGGVDYRITVSWVTAAGLTRTRNVNMRAEAEQHGDAWSVVRHRIVSGWR